MTALIKPMTTWVDAGQVASASSELDSTYYAAWMAFDDNVASFWHSANVPSLPGWLKIQLSWMPMVCSMSFQNRADGQEPSQPLDFTLSGSNDDSYYEVLLSITGNYNNGIGDVYGWNFSRGNTYMYYRLDITNGVMGLYANMTQMQLYDVPNGWLPPPPTNRRRRFICN